MRSRYSVDRESFETFLRNAYAVQESGLDPHSLSALTEIQRFVTSDDFELNRAMHMIAERALGVSHASGIAVALLEPNKNELVYRAGSGSVANDVGRRVPAVLSASSLQETRREILRVENAESDKRIEAEICRQFGALALLMLPIYKSHVLVGVLQVLFAEAHSFLDREVRTYRLMVGALEDGILRDLQREEKQRVVRTVEQPSNVPVVSEQYAQPVQNIAGTPEVFAAAGKQNTAADSLVREPDPASSLRGKAIHDHVAVILREVSAVWNELTRAIGNLETRAWNANLRFAGPAIAAAVMVTIIVSIFHLSRFSDMKISSSVSTLHDAPQQLPGKDLLMNDESKRLSVEQKEYASPGSGFRRVRIGPNEVDYIADDVTIRHFEIRPPKPQIRRSAQKEMSFGDDVTVRYFANTPALVSERPSDSKVKPTTNKSSFQSQ